MDYLTAAANLTGTKPESAPIIIKKVQCLYFRLDGLNSVNISCDNITFISSSNFKLTRPQLDAILFIQDWLNKELEKAEEIWDLYVFDKWGEDKVLVFSGKKSLADEKFDIIHKTNCFMFELRKR